jgi:dTDP-4-amino-4,6-dideoxygalactose transaminase
MAKSNADKLALLGGTSVCQPLVAPTWPLPNEATAKRLAEIYMSGQWSFNGPVEQAFCQEFAKAQDAKHGIFMVNGTVTLECAMAVVGVGPGDEVIVPANTWLATAMAAIYLGAKPVFVDVEPTTLCMDPAAFEAAITPRTKAVVPVHLFGSNPDLYAIMGIAKKHGVGVIEDCAHGHGGKWDGKGLGSHGQVGSFSFQQSKTLPSGESGICLTNDDDTAERLFRLKHIGYAPGAGQGMAKSGPPEGLVCRNYRGNEFHAAILQDELVGLQERIAKYNRNAKKMEDRLAGVPGVRVQSRGRLAGPQSYYAFVLVFDQGPMAGIPIDRIVEAARAEGLPFIGARGYGPVYSHMLWNVAPGHYGLPAGGCPVAETTGTQRIASVQHQVLGADDATIDRIGEIIAKVAGNAEELGSMTD